jgi:glutamyl-tRNA reductase
MTFFAFGLNHETASVGVTEAFALDETAQRILYAELDLDSSAEVILLSTCNRTEAYLYGTLEDVERVQQALAAEAGQDWPEEEAFFCRDEAAVRHVLEVTSGLRSMVLGDAQILAQVKEAYRRAVDADAVNTLLHRLMHTAFRAAKRVASETAISSGAASVSSAAVAMARDHFSDVVGGSLEGADVLLVGAGKMGRLALQAMQSYTPRTIRVTNRSPERAQEVAKANGADVVSWDERHRAASTADVVIVATGAPDPVLQAEALPSRPDHRVAALLIDISMPRNIDPAVDAEYGYKVMDLDALRAWTNRVEAQRSAEVPDARAICDDLLGDFVTWVFHQQALQPAIQAIRDTFDEIRTQEIDRHAHRFSELDRDELEQITQSIMQKLLAVPIVRLKNVDPESIDFVRGIELLRALFERPGCEDESASQQNGTDASTKQPRLSDVPEGCPFDETEGVDRSDDEEFLRRILRRSSSEA